MGGPGMGWSRFGRVSAVQVAAVRFWGRSGDGPGKSERSRVTAGEPESRRTGYPETGRTRRAGKLETRRPGDGSTGHALNMKTAQLQIEVPKVTRQAVNTCAQHKDVEEPNIIEKTGQTKTEAPNIMEVALKTNAQRVRSAAEVEKPNIVKSRFRRSLSKSDGSRGAGPTLHSVTVVSNPHFHMWRPTWNML